ncbi:hypothetical protein L6R52_16690 [Myxococcota bacterium]|nr:hypothetical protein [Myxococcota bacterium]
MFSACASPQTPVGPPEGASWRTLHQGYFKRVLDVAVDHKGDGRTEVTKSAAAKQALQAQTPGSAGRLEHLAPGDLATRAILGGSKPSGDSAAARALNEARRQRKR